MIGILVVTHANLGEGFIDAATLIAGKQPLVKAIGLHHGDGVNEFEEKVMQALQELDEGDGVLGFCDFVGGTPSNTLLRCMQKKEFPCIAGVNMSMFIEALMSRGSIQVFDLEQQCMAAGHQGVSRLQDVFAEMSSAAESDEDEI